MEIYANSATREVFLDFPIAPSDIHTMNVTIEDSEGEVLHEVSTVIPEDDGRYSITVPFSVIGKNSPFVVKWDIEYFEDGQMFTHNVSTPVTIVTPLLSLTEIRYELDLSESQYSDAAIIKAERKARVMIENATGQTFAPSEETLDAQISANGSLRLPKRLQTLITVDGVMAPSLYVIDPTGFRLAVRYPRKRDDIRASGFPISAPPNRRTMGVTKVRIKGRWGYDAVPMDIKEAALLLIEQELCPDSLYRERYLESMTAADWRMQFNSQAYSGTGNVVADKILAKYQQSNMAVV